MPNTEKFDDIHKAMKELRKNTIYNYRYRYYKGDENGMTLDTNLNALYGDGRDGYERFKTTPNIIGDTVTEPGQVDCSYAGVVSLRSLTDRKTDKIFGYITEEKLSFTPHRDKAKDLYSYAIDELKEILKVTDTKAFDFYIDNTISFDWLSKDGVDDFLSAFEELQNILEEYKTDEAFKHFLDKIIH